MEQFTVKHYSSDERPTIKGNGFDGLEIGEDREEAEEFIEFVNKLIDEHDEGLAYFYDEVIINEMEHRGYTCVKQNPSCVKLQDLYELKRTGKIAEFDTAFSDYCWQEIGRIL